MKQIILIALLFTTSLQTRAQNSSIDFLIKTMPELIQSAQNTDKLIFIDITATWCKPCKEMEKTTFTDESVISYFSKHFLSKKIFIDEHLIEPDSISLKYRDKSQTVPTFYFLDSFGNVLFTTEGFKTPTEMLNLGAKAKNIISPEYQISKMQNIYIANKNDKDFLFRYLKLKNEIGDKDNRALNDYLKLIPTEKIGTDTVIYTIIKHESDIYGQGYKIISGEYYRTEASVIASRNNGDTSIGYKMYVASLDIIKSNAVLATKNNDKDLLKFCISEINRVMQNKSKATETAYDFKLQFEGKNGKINR